MPRREYVFYVYIMSSPSGTLYVGVTNDLAGRVMEHKEGKFRGFTKRYGCKSLVFYERFSNIDYALEDEKRVKSWRREKKEELIRRMNPSWKDLGKELM